MRFHRTNVFVVELSPQGFRIKCFSKKKTADQKLCCDRFSSTMFKWLSSHRDVTFGFLNAADRPAWFVFISLDRVDMVGKKPWWHLPERLRSSRTGNEWGFRKGTATSGTGPLCATHLCRHRLWRRWKGRDAENSKWIKRYVRKMSKRWLWLYFKRLTITVYSSGCSLLVNQFKDRIHLCREYYAIPTWPRSRLLKQSICSSFQTLFQKWCSDHYLSRQLIL